MKKLIVLLPLALGACTTFPQVESMARPATVIETSNKQAVLDKIVELCDRTGLQIDKTEAGSVTCSRESSLATQVLLGTKYGTNVRTRTQFNVFPLSKGKMKVAPRSWAENQNAFGQTNTTEMDTAVVRQYTQQILDQAKLEIEKK